MQTDVSRFGNTVGDKWGKSTNNLKFTKYMNMLHHVSMLVL